MEEKESREFSWTLLFLVTGVSFLGFRVLLKLLEETTLPIFTWIGITCLCLGALCGLNTMSKAETKNTD
jgi:hypothetical protein